MKKSDRWFRAHAIEIGIVVVNIVIWVVVARAYEQDRAVRNRILTASERAWAMATEIGELRFRRVPSVPSLPEEYKAEVTKLRQRVDQVTAEIESEVRVVLDTR